MATGKKRAFEYLIMAPKAVREPEQRIEDALLVFPRCQTTNIFQVTPASANGTNTTPVAAELRANEGMIATAFSLATAFARHFARRKMPVAVAVYSGLRTQLHVSRVSGPELATFKTLPACAGQRS